MSRKGPSYEREVCKALSLWWTDGVTDDVFWRSAASGGRATVRGRQGMSMAGHYGDICATNPIGQPLIDLVTIEIKRGYSDCSIHEILDRPGNRGPQEFEGFLLQAIDACDRADTIYWWLIHRRDSREAMIYYPLSLDEKLGRKTDPRPLLQLTCHLSRKPGADLRKQLVRIVGMRFKDFLETVDPTGLLLMED